MAIVEEEPVSHRREDIARLLEEDRQVLERSRELRQRHEATSAEAGRTFARLRDVLLEIGLVDQPAGSGRGLRRRRA